MQLRGLGGKTVVDHPPSTYGRSAGERRPCAHHLPIRQELPFQPVITSPASNPLPCSSVPVFYARFSDRPCQSPVPRLPRGTRPRLLDLFEDADQARLGEPVSATQTSQLWRRVEATTAERPRGPARPLAPVTSLAGADAGRTDDRPWAGHTGIAAVAPSNCFQQRQLPPARPPRAAPVLDRSALAGRSSDKPCRRWRPCSKSPASSAFAESCQNQQRETNTSMSPETEQNNGLGNVAEARERWSSRSVPPTQYPTASRS